MRGQVAEEDFRRAEASFLLEGMDSSDDAEYQSLKAQIVAGTMDIDEAIRLTAAHFKATSRSSAKELTAAG